MSSASATVRVEKATSDLLIGPDWTMNMDICDSINSNPGLAKDVVKAVKKRLQNKSPRVHFLAVTLLETMVKNCGDYVHFQVVDRGILQEMVKIVKKRTDMQVREKILVLLDSWQEAFGGPGGKYPQYYWVYIELKRSGVQFPQRSPDSALIFTPPVTSPANPQTGYGMPSGSTLTLDEAMTSEMSNLSLSDLDRIRSVMELLCDMLKALRQDDREAVKDEVITDLVSQCHSNQKKLMKLLNSTGDEELLAQGLALNDDLQNLLAKHDAIASGSPLPAVASGSSLPAIASATPLPSEPSEATPGPGTPAAPAPGETSQYDDGEEEDDDFAQLARRNSKYKASTQSSLAETSGQLASPNHSDEASVSSSSVGSNALALSDPPAPVKTSTKEQDIIELLSITISDPPLPSPPHIPLTPSASFENRPPVSLPPSGPTSPLNNQQQPYMTNQHQPYMGNQGYTPYNSYVAPWAQTQPRDQPQVSQLPTNYPPPPWEATSSSNPNAFSSASYRYPSVAANYAAPYVPMQASGPVQQYIPATSTETQTTANPRQTGHGASPKPYVPPYRLFEDLVDLRNTDKGAKSGDTSATLSGPTGQSMIGGRK